MIDRYIAIATEVKSHRKHAGGTDKSVGEMF